MLSGLRVAPFYSPNVEKIVERYKAGLRPLEAKNLLGTVVAAVLSRELGAASIHRYACDVCSLRIAENFDLIDR